MQAQAVTHLHHYIRRWDLRPDGSPFFTASSLLQPVIFQDIPAMIKIAMQEEEDRGSRLMHCWNGNGTVPVLKYETPALLMERAARGHPDSLAEMAAGGKDDEASRILCHVADRLHAAGSTPPSFLFPLSDWFRE
ncbi:MAG: aminoglycoside phosphotransferase family protein, partial [Chitinophaga rupis]